MGEVYSAQEVTSAKASIIGFKWVGTLVGTIFLFSQLAWGISYGPQRANCASYPDSSDPTPVCDPFELAKLHKNVDYTLAAGPNEIKIMTYNVQNLFDVEHDAGKTDEEFLPKNHPAKIAACNALKTPAQTKECLAKDWTQDRVELKLVRIRQAISLQGSLPDLLAVQEIENASVAKQLAAALGYAKFVITNSPDQRGIDVALFFNEDKLTFVGSKETVILYEQGSPLHKPTRNILTARFLIPGTPKGKEEYLGVYVNHWPSQMAPSESRYMAGLKLRELIQADLDLYGRGRYHVVATGDFNTGAFDVPHAHLNTILDPNWKDKMRSIHDILDHSPLPTAAKARAGMPPGTIFYPPSLTWDRFDQFFVSASLTDTKGAEVVSDSLRVVAHSAITESFHETKNEKSPNFSSVVFGIPWRFDHYYKTPADSGFSDHFPVVAKIQLR